MLCTLIGAIILSINVQAGLNMHLYDDIGMHRRPFEGRYLVNKIGRIGLLATCKMYWACNNKGTNTCSLDRY